MKRYIKSSTNAKILSLDMFDVDEYDFKTKYKEQHRIDYELDIDGYRIKIYMVFGNRPYNISFKYPSGYTGEVSGFLTAQDAIDYLNDNKWWNFQEPDKAAIDRSMKYDKEMHKLNTGALNFEDL